MKRYIPLDILRGLTIFGMILSAIEPHGVLPAWMYHIQNPPPTHELNMMVAGISWVDLVFPIFIFCMGVAIPIAGRRSASSLSAKEFCKKTFERFLMLWLFSYLYIFLNFDNGGEVSFWAQLLTILGFLYLFSIYMVFPKSFAERPLFPEGSKLSRFSIKMGSAIRIAGFLDIIIIIIIGHFCFDEVISIHRRGIIIFLLAFLYLFGALIWYFTRDKIKLRIGILLLVFIFTIITQQLDLPAITYANREIRWWFNFEYFYFLLLLIPSTVVGDLIYKRLSESNSTTITDKNIPLWQRVVFSIILFGTVIWFLYAFYTRINILFNAAVTLTALSLLFFFIKREFQEYRNYFAIIILLLVAGFIMEPLDGGIKKVPCTISYCFITAGISLMLLLAIDLLHSILEKRKSLSRWILAGAGENPLLSYIAFGNFILPLMKLTALISLYQACYPTGMPWVGFIRSFVMTALTLAFVAFLSKKKIRWRA